jgi:hypothetical protein
MNSRIYKVGDNSFHNRGFPWIKKFDKGLEHNYKPCLECGGGPISTVVGDLHAILEPNKGRKWPDVLGCGAWSALIVSERVLNDWKMDGIGNVPVGGGVTFVPPLPKRMDGSPPPNYFWIDSAKIVGARMDQEASGFVGVQYCPMCGRRTWDISATFDRQHSRQWGGYVLRDWDGATLFSTSEFGGMYFCTKEIVECARLHRHTNFRFVPIEEGIAAGSAGLRYLSPKPPIK